MRGGVHSSTDLALDWYSAVADADPVWREREGMMDKTKRWAPPQRERMQALHAGWLARGDVVGGRMRQVARGRILVAVMAVRQDDRKRLGGANRRGGAKQEQKQQTRPAHGTPFGSP